MKSEKKPAEQDKQTRPEIVIVGFPKCGTSALFRALESDEDIFALRAENGHIELPWPQIKNVTTETPKGKIRLHKLPGYIYNEAALDYLVTSNPDSLLVVCIRDPQKALVSWWNMHRNIARSDTPSEHFAYVERDFYADCDVNQYHEAYARTRLDYSNYIEQLISVAGRDRVVIVSQERMAQGIEPITEFVIRAAKGQQPDAPAETVSDDPHQGFADAAKVGINPAHIAELEAYKIKLYRTVANSRVLSVL